MYNRYIPKGTGYTRVVVEERERANTSGPSSGQPSRSQTGGKASRSGQSSHGQGQEWFQNLTGPLRFLGREDKNAGVAGILNALHLDDLDSGDILLLLIMLFLFLEGDNIELVITLGLMLLLGLGDEKKESELGQNE